MRTLDLTCISSFANHFFLSDSSIVDQVNAYIAYLDDEPAFIAEFNATFPNI